MTSFSERIGVHTPRTSFQLTSLEKETRVALWNTMLEFQSDFDHMELTTPWRNANSLVLTDKLWIDFFRKPYDELNQFLQVWNITKHHTLTAAWNEVLDLVESFAQYMQQVGMSGYSFTQGLTEQFNAIFEREMVGYRFIGTEITPITAARDIEAIEKALSNSDEFLNAQYHLDRALEHLSDKQTPNYANSIKESISAVEGVVKVLTNSKFSLGEGLNKLEKAGLKIHPALKDAWKKIYGWTSDDDGIRHGGIKPAEADQSLAKYMLISCSAFVSYLIEEAGKKDIAP